MSSLFKLMGSVLDRADDVAAKALTPQSLPPAPLVASTSADERTIVPLSCACLLQLTRFISFACLGVR